MSPLRKLAVPANGQWLPVLHRGGDEPPSAKETQPFLATSNQPFLTESEILEPSFLEAQRSASEAAEGLPPHAVVGQHSRPKHMTHARSLEK